MPPASTAARAVNSSNRFSLDYEAEAARLGPPPCPIIDVHSHINGERAARIYKRAADIYGVQTVYSMTQLEQVPAMREIFGERMRFIAVPNWAGTDKRFDMHKGFMQRIEKYHALGCRIVKFWAAPRSAELAAKMGEPEAMKLNAPGRIEIMQHAHDLGMIFMTHVGDPDTWFATKYADAKTYGTKRQQYEPLEELLDRFMQPWIAAHMGGWPEDLEFLDGLLTRHANLYLDTSAAKWMIREISKHPREELLRFLKRWRGRIMFGSDIVTTDDHLAEAKEKTEMSAKASSREQAFDLYASRYWALRTMWETDYEGASPIADPDLHMVEPARYGEMDAPALAGKSLPRDVLLSLYHDSAATLLDSLHAP
jgi:predicted TIM-barrel fold metal-dependent hydrolase